MSVDNSSLYDVTGTHVYVTDATNGTEKCVAINNLFTIAFIPFKVIVTFLNLILFAAAARDRKKLQRQTYMFYCVMSTLLSNTVYLLMSIWLTVDNYAQTAREPQEGIMSIEKGFWILSEAITVSMIIGISANVTSLIYVTIDSVVYVGRAGADLENNGAKKENAMRFKIRVARGLVIASWVLPVIITALTFAWNCAEHCRCPSNNFEGEHCPRDRDCSSMWAPLMIEFLFMVVGIWTIEMIGLIVFLIKGIRRHMNEGKGPKSSTKRTSKIESDNETVRTPSESSTLPMQTTKTSFRRRFNWRLKFSVTLTALLVICTLPGIISIILDTALPDAPDGEMILVSGVFMFVYCALFPIVLWRFLPSLRSSTYKFLVGIKTCSCIKSRDASTHVHAAQTQGH